MGRKPAFYNDYQVVHEDPIGVRIAKRRAQLNAEHLKERKESGEEGLPYKNLTQQRLADACGVSRDTVKNWERGSEEPKVKNLEILCRILDCDYDFLLGRIDVPYVQEFNIEEHLGLSEQGRLNLHVLPSYSTELARVFDDFVSGTEFFEFLAAVNHYRQATERLQYVENNPEPNRLYLIPNVEGADLSLSAVRTDKAMNCYMFEAQEIVRAFMERHANLST